MHLMQSHAYRLISVHLELDEDLLMFVSFKGNLEFADYRSHGTVLDHEERLNLLFELLLSEEEISSRGVLSCMFDNSIKELSRDVFQLKSTSEIEISTRISKIVVICIFNIENLHEIVMFSSR